jgi:hypothetical protein
VLLGLALLAIPGVSGWWLLRRGPSSRPTAPVGPRWFAAGGALHATAIGLLVAWTGLVFLHDGLGALRTTLS